MPAGSLQGQHIWLARPGQQAQPWARALRRAGAHVDCQSLLEIVPPANIQAAQAGLVQAEQADFVIVASPNAAHFAWQLRPNFKPVGQLCSVGQATAQYLEKTTGRGVITPKLGDTSEDLLAQAELKQVASKKLVLLTGQGGRKKMLDTLTERGARVTKIALYRRQPALIKSSRLRQLLSTNNAIVITSGSALDNLCTLIRQEQKYSNWASCLDHITLIVPSQRVAKLVPADIFKQPARALPQVSAQAVINTLAL